MRRVLLVLVLLGLPAAAEPHDPIRIVSNSDFVALGATGSGTADDPYILADLDIERPLFEINPATTAIHVQATDAHAVLRDISVADAFELGIRLFEASNVTLEQITLDGLGRAIWVDGSKDIRIDGAELMGGTAREGASGLTVTASERVYLRNLSAQDGNGPGVQISTSRWVRVEGMEVAHHAGGLRVQSSQDVNLFGVVARENRGDGVWISNVTRIGVFGLDVVGQTSTQGINSGRGLVAWDSTGDLFSVNAQDNAGIGIMLYNADLELHTGHALDNGGAGIHLELAQSRLSDFEIHGNGGYGLELFAPPGGRGFADVHDLHIHDNDGGLYAQGLDALNAYGLRIEFNDGPGAVLQSIGNMSLLTSVVSENDGHGLYAKAVGGQLMQNRFEANAQHGAMFEGASRVSIVENHANRNGGSGLFLQGGQFRVEANQAHDNGGYGIEVGPDTNATLQGNAATGNARGDLGDGVRQKGVPFPMAWALIALLGVLHQRTKSV